jgi:hypothetical protein
VTQRAERQIRLATIARYSQFCRRTSAYRHCMANQLHIMNWIDERRIEMTAEGRPRWVPSVDDFWQAARDCGDDLVKRI